MKLTSADLRRLAELPAETLPNVLRMMAEACELDDARRARDAARKRKIRGQSVDNPRNILGQSQDNPRTILGQSQECPTVLVSPKKINKTLSRNRVSNQEVRTSVSIPRVKKPTGSRLPEDWNPTEELWQKAKAKLGMTDEQLRFETGAFKDHWHASASPNSFKLDWNGAWRNWMRESCRRGGNGGRQHRSTGAPRQETLVEQCDRVGRWMIERDEENARRSENGTSEPGSGSKILEDYYQLIPPLPKAR